MAHTDEEGRKVVDAGLPANKIRKTFEVRKGLVGRVVELTTDDRERFVIDFRPAPPIQPQDEWERRLLAVAKDCGVSLPDSAVSSEGLYD
jgi:hypothetical protein